MRLLLFVFSLTTLLTCSPIAPSSSPRSPNVLLILTDDQGYGDLGIHGNDSLSTPVQDQLARSGIRLDNFYVSPVCAPTRASLLTGRYHYRTGTTWVTRNGEAMRSEEVTLAEVFKANGYATGCFGKWHNGAHYPQNPNGQGFDHFTGFCGGHWYRYNNPTLEHNGEEYASEGYITDILTDSTLAFIDRHQAAPFFAYVPFNTPHTPFIAPQKLYEKYLQQGRSKEVASTYAMIENIDQNIGRILQKLEALQLREETIIIFMTDNGPNFDRYNAGMKGRKGWVNDGGVRVPSFWSWKGHWPAGQVSQALTSHIDVLPTLLDLLDLKAPSGPPLDGQSFADLLNGQSTELPDRTLFTFSINLQKYKGAVRTRDHRLTITEKDNYTLTHLLNDPAEARDLSGDKKQLADRLYQAYLQAYQEVTKEADDFLPIAIGHPQAPRVELFAHEGFPLGNARYQGSKWGWCNDWIVDWKAATDTIYWNVEVVKAGTYQVALKYNCGAEQLGPMVQVAAGAARTQARISAAFEGAFLPSFKQVEKQVETEERSWGRAELGVIELKAGRQQIRLFATETKGEEVAAVKSLLLKKIGGS